ncbi:Integral membrane protein [Roseomonas mucosa]|uniref:Inner membrane protein yccS n=2 Tax=Roseomonas TaxID=125216 RepID=A0A1S8DBG2_9PROT|nr:MULTISPECIES: FUSC family protein [Roseomonas]MBS5901920.1 FUSC family protein [Acetobacteraceae bacterium]MCG7350149.1 FUSC family protein [Roseomonas mucosa]MCG7355072.1 FUSC family protein [Roseomonas mucosa]MDT8289750.1 FUSC family protein [Roseomonas mucosa]MDT8292552.1 FUSC family protein [Roseomonas mucosa]
MTPARPRPIARRRAGPAWPERLSARLGRWSISLSPRAVSLGEGLRAAAACALVVLVMELLHWPALSWAAIAALWTCLADPGGPGRERARLMAGYAAVSTLCALAGAVSGGLGWPFAAALLCLCTFLGGLGRLYGAAITQAGALAVVAFAVAADQPVHSAGAALEFGLIFAGGCLWALLLSLTLWRIHPFRPSRLALAAAFRDLAALCADLDRLLAEGSTENAWGEHAGRHRRAVRLSIENARAALEQLLRARGLRDAVGRLLIGLETAERLFALLIALEDRLEEQGQRPTPPDRRAARRQLRQLAVVLLRQSRLMEAGQPPDARLRAALARLEAMPAAPESEAGEGLHAMAAALRGMIDNAPAGPPAPQPRQAHRFWVLLLANLRWESLVFRHALRSAVLVTGVMVLAHLLELPQAYWATMAVILVQQPEIATTWPRALERAVGSVLGGLAAAFLGWVLEGPLALTLAIFPLAMATLAVRGVSYALFVFFLTPLFVLLVDLTVPGASHAGLAGLRAFNNVLGSVIALAGAMLLWPERAPQRLRLALAGALEAHARYAALAFGPDADRAATEAARRAAGLASVNAEALRERAAREPWGQVGEHGGEGERRQEAAGTALLLLRRLAGASTAVWLQSARHSRSGDPAFGRQLAAGLEAVAAALRAGRASPEPAWPPEEGLSPEQRRALRQARLLQQAGARYLG